MAVVAVSAAAGPRADSHQMMLMMVVVVVVYDYCYKSGLMLVAVVDAVEIDDVGTVEIDVVVGTVEIDVIDVVDVIVEIDVVDSAVDEDDHEILVAYFHHALGVADL